MIESKSSLLTQYKQELASATTKAQETQETICKCEQEIDQIKIKIEASPDLKAQNALRETYLEIKSKLQAENA